MVENYSEDYIKSFGKTTEKEKKMIKETYGYVRCQLADKVKSFKKEFKKAIIESFKGIIKRNRG